MGLDLQDTRHHWLEGRSGQASTPAAPLFYVPTGLRRILDRDLIAAGIPKIDDRGRSLDAHALRTTFGTHLSMAGVPLRTAQTAIRHSTPALTTNDYTDPRLLDVHGAIESLPALAITASTTQTYPQLFPPQAQAK